MHLYCNLVFLYVLNVAACTSVSLPLMGGWKSWYQLGIIFSWLHQLCVTAKSLAMCRKVRYLLGQEQTEQLLLHPFYSSIAMYADDH